MKTFESKNILRALQKKKRNFNKCRAFDEINSNVIKKNVRFKSNDNAKNANSVAEKKHVEKNCMA